MSTSLNAVLGIAFLGLAIAATYTMFQFWGYPYDKEKRKSECPQWKMNIHRGIGFAYLIIYVILMAQMVPRLWTYQVEFPARTVAHMMLGMGIGVILLVKISIIRFFRHFEEWMPALGVLLLLFTVLLSGLSLPFVFKERALAAGAEGGSAVSAKNLARTRKQLERVDFGAEGLDLDTLSTENGLMAGREVLLNECVYCHDLKTSISKPRTGQDWWRTVKRMAGKPTLGPRLSPLDQHQVTAYLIAITPELQDSMEDKREREEGLKKSAAALVAPDAGVPSRDGGLPKCDPAINPDCAKLKDIPKPEPKKIDMAKAKEVYEDLCAQCHDLSDVDDEPPTTAAEAKELIKRMVVDNGLEEEEPGQFELIEAYLIEAFVKKK